MNHINKLVFNSLSFEFPKEPVNCYFGKTYTSSSNLTRLASDILWPKGIKSVFPELSNVQEIYTSFNVYHEELTPFPVDLSLRENYYFAKRYYNLLIKDYFLKTIPNSVLKTNSITKDNEIWIKSPENSSFKDCARFDRYTIKVDYDYFKKRPQIIVAYMGFSHVLYTSVAELLNKNNNILEATDQTKITEIINQVIYYVGKKKTGKDFIVDRYKYLAENKTSFVPGSAYPVLNRGLINYLGYEFPTFTNAGNPLLNYFNKIQAFYNSYLNNNNFRSVIPITQEGFTPVDECQMGSTSLESSNLIFGHNAIGYNPVKGLNNGPFMPVPGINVELICVFHSDEKNYARFLMNHLKTGYLAYKDYSAPVINQLTGKTQNIQDVLSKFTGKVTEFAKFFIEFKDNRNPSPEVVRQLTDAYTNGRLKRDGNYMALYVSPISKQDRDYTAKKAYSVIKDAFLTHGIMTQVIVADTIGYEDKNHRNSKGEFEIVPCKGFDYTLQNMALAICAKMGGTPWKIATQKKNELVIGVGAFYNREKGATYIGSAFSFDNTGTFNSFECFMKDQMTALVGSMKDAITKFASINGKPDKVVIHYYKVMSRKYEYKPIEDMLGSLNLGQIPIYVVTVNKTDSEDFVVFDLNHQSLLPYSGTYFNLGNRKYLLCNNTRYQNFNGRIDGFPFPIKLRIWSPQIKDDQINSNIIQDLIEQVYQFSRIYFKSVKQQHLPVTLKYSELVSEMLSSFENLSTENVDSDKLWFL